MPKQKVHQCGTTALGRNRMSAESAHLSTFGAETETEAEIRSTSTLKVKSCVQALQGNGRRHVRDADHQGLVQSVS